LDGDAVAPTSSKGLPGIRVGRSQDFWVFEFQYVGRIGKEILVRAICSLVKGPIDDQEALKIDIKCNIMRVQHEIHAGVGANAVGDPDGRVDTACEHVDAARQ